jgi:hypothetical protein
LFTFISLRLCPLTTLDFSDSFQVGLALFFSSRFGARIWVIKTGDLPG